jgi:hypothetical protein
VAVATAHPRHGLKGWLLADAPGTAFQARCQRAYLAWVVFRGNPIAMAGFIIIASLVLMAVFAPWLTGGNGLTQNLADRLLPPNAEHWLGTDQLGRDIFDRIVWGSRITLYIVGLVAVLVVPIGLAIGIVAGYSGGWVSPRWAPASRTQCSPSRSPLGRLMPAFRGPRRSPSATASSSSRREPRALPASASCAATWCRSACRRLSCGSPSIWPASS